MRPMLLLLASGAKPRSSEHLSCCIFLLLDSFLAPPPSLPPCPILPSFLPPIPQSPLENLHGHKLPSGTPNSAWLSLDLLETLCSLGDVPGLEDSVLQVVAGPMRVCPELLTVGLAQAQVRADCCSVRAGGHCHFSRALSMSSIH